MFVRYRRLLDLLCMEDGGIRLQRRQIDWLSAIRGVTLHRFRAANRFTKTSYTRQDILSDGRWRGLC